MTKNEIDLSDMIDCIWVNKWKIVLITFLTLIISLFIKLNSKIPQTSYIAKTEIVPISTFDDFEYSAFNTFILNQESRGVKGYFSKDFTNQDMSLTFNFQNNSIPKNKYLRPIDKKYLNDLFIEKINQKELFVRGIKKFNIVKKEDYLNKKDYEAAVIKLASSIEISNTQKTENSQFIKFQTVNKKTWEELLYFVENSTNSEIRDYLKNSFRLLISSIERSRKFNLEDIELEIENNLEDELIVSKLNKIKKSKEDNKIVERLVTLFESTPIMSDDFVASKLNVQLTKYKKIQNNNYSTKKVIIVSIILGVLLGIMYVLIANKLIKRKKEI